ncbi:hypothetical protein [Pseudoduganella armeniaca]|uniref:hypothetical protein n=1 Tax=Pseudoduganella armeniaca TaxID=2072590 RepID=UPI0011B1CFF6|nr:hypothetical protein [Pseudoduganella armeniaca]
MNTAGNICATLALILISGCADIGAINKDRQNIPFKAFPDTGNAAIYLWPPYTSAAIVDPQGNRCVLAASGVQTANISAEGSLKAADILGKVANLDASTKSTLIEAFHQISQPDNRAAALDVALFHLCILDQNGTFQKLAGNSTKGLPLLEAYREIAKAAMEMSK